MATGEQRAWIRALRNDRYELFVRMGDCSLRATGSLEFCESLITATEESTQERITEIPERHTRFGRPRLMPGTMQLFGEAPDLSPI